MKSASHRFYIFFIALCLFIVPVVTKGQVTSGENRTAGRDLSLISQPEREKRVAVEQVEADASQKSATTTTTNTGYVFPTQRERVNRYVWQTFGPLALVGVGVSAGINQAYNDPPEWHKGSSGYGKRFASELGQYTISQTTSFALSEAFHLDSGFQKSQRHGFGPRLGDALLQNVTSRTRSGKRIISAPRFAGFYVGGIIPAVTWYPSRFSYKDGLRSGTYALGAGFAVNVLREFIFHR